MKEGTTARTPRGLVLAACMMATFTAAVESTIVAAALPTIVADIKGAELYSWVFSAYLLTQAVTIPIYGRLADLLGRKRVFVAGAVLFLVGSALCGLAHGIVALIAFRALQGCGAGAVQPIAYTIVADIYTPVERARVQGLLSGVFGAAAIAGPGLGAALVQFGGWRSVFWINVPVVALAIVMMIVFLHEKVLARRARLDLAGSLLLTLGISATVVAADRWKQIGFAGVAAALIVGLASFVALVRHEMRTPEPIVPSVLSKNRIVVSGSIGAFAIGVTIMSVIAFLPSYVQAAMGHSATMAGAVLGVMMVVWTLSSIAAGQLIVYVPYRTAGCAGAGLIVGGAVLLIALVPGSSVIHAAVGASVVGIGLGLCNTTWIVSVQTRVAYEIRGSATSAVMFMRFLGQALGAAAGGVILSIGLQVTIPQVADPLGALLDWQSTASAMHLSRSVLVAAVSCVFRGVFVMTALMGFAALVMALQLPRGMSARTPVRSGG